MKFILSIAVATTLLLISSANAAQQIPADGEWALVPNTLLGPVLPTKTEIGIPWCAETEGCPGAHLNDWTSLVYDSDQHKICSVRNGGHDDAGAADSYCIKVDDAMNLLPPTNGLTHWYRAEPVQHLDLLTGQVDINGNPICNMPTQGGPSIHTYGAVTYLGNGIIFWAGNTGYCHGAYMNPKHRSYFVDTKTTPWTWTPSILTSYVASGASARDGQYIYTVNGKWAIADKDTGSIIAFGTQMKGVIKNGVTQPFMSGFGVSASAAGINIEHLFCMGDKTYITCSNTQGTQTGDCTKLTNTTCNDDSFGRFIKRGIGLNAPVGSIASKLNNGYYSMTPLPDGRFVIWFGGKDLYLFKPGAGNNPALDTWEEFHPATGPVDGTKGRVYQKIFWNEQYGVLMGVSNTTDYKDPTTLITYPQGMWIFKVPGLSTTLPSIPPQETGDYGLPPTAKLVDLCIQPTTLLCDPLDSGKISGPYITDTTKNLTIPSATAGRYGDWRWVWQRSDKVTPKIDIGTKVEGDASLMFTIPSQSGAGAASLYTVDIDPNHIAAHGVGIGETIRVRIKVRWSCDVLYVDCNPASSTYKQIRRHYLTTAGYGGIKIFSIGEGDRPDFYMDSGEGLGGTVTGNYKQRGVYDSYVQVWYALIEKSYPKINGITQWDMEPGGINNCWTNDPITGKGLTEAWPKCHFLQSDQWVTIQGELSYGGCTSNSKDPALLSRWKLWVADEDKSFDLVTDQRINIRCSGQPTTLPDSTFGKIWLTPYNTGKDPTEIHPTGYVWYDNLWVEKFPTK